ncbi:hypothetical protein CCACVL1_23503 [Corchorus capsularis]|uniref:Uncharacterized protein n=1 Tax=Corchorus capsularis TaxID=210143 RepID=A0A1R3GTW0_COCAP|nr:hypothetical protein CCACVL1_23503 [Corchorus capsularis]
MEMQPVAIAAFPNCCQLSRP